MTIDVNGNRGLRKHVLKISTETTIIGAPMFLVCAFKRYAIEQFSWIHILIQERSEGSPSAIARQRLSVRAPINFAVTVGKMLNYRPMRLPHTLLFSSC